MKLNRINIENLKKNKFPSSPLKVTTETVPANHALEGRIGSAIWLVTLKGLMEI